MSPDAGTTIGPYTINREIGRGGMGVVYLARDTRLDRDVAIKSLPEHLASDSERLARFEREAKALAALNHPNVAGIHGVEEQDGARYLILEYVEGETLAERLDHGAIQIEEARTIACQIASGVEAAHEAGVVHRDLKPANIKFDGEGKAKVLDFGLARADESSTTGSSVSQLPTLTSPANTPTMAGVILGTAAYMSPEQARGRKVDKRTDIWSFGVVLYEMLVGASPFIGETVTDSIGAILHKDLDLDRLPRDTPSNVRNVLRRCLERDRSERYRDIGDVRIELQEMSRLSDAEAASASSGGIVLAIVAASIIGLIASFATWLVLRGAESEPAQVVRFSVPMAEQVDRSGLAFGVLAISPDGQTIVYSAGSGGRTHLYVRHLDDDESRLLPHTDGGRTPFFSTDGERLGFFSEGQLKWIDMAGGAPVTVASFPGLQYGACWLPDGRILYSTSQDKSLSIIDPESRRIEQIDFEISGQSIGAYRWPVLLPDNRHVLVTRIIQSNPDSGNQLVVVDTQTGNAKSIGRGVHGRVITPDILFYSQGDTVLAQRLDMDIMELVGRPQPLTLDTSATQFDQLWVDLAPNGTLVYFPSEANDARGQMVWVDQKGQETAISEEEAYFGAPRLSPDGTRVAYWNGAVLDGRYGVMVYDIPQGRSLPIDVGALSGSYPLWSKDGRTIESLVISPETGWSWRSTSANGSSPARILFQSEEAQLVTSRDPHGDGAIGYEVNPVTNRDIWIMDSLEERHPLLATPANERAPRISPDGKWFVYVSDQSGQDEVYVTSYPDAQGMYLVSLDGGAEPLWSPDGASLYYRVDDAMMRVPIEPSESGFDWSRPEEIFTGLYQRDFFGNANYDISLDGQQLLMVTQIESGEAEIRVVLNWASEIRALLSE